MRLFGHLYLARLRRSLLVGCLTAAIGGPMVCVGLYLLLNVVAPAAQESSATGLPLVMVLLFSGIVLLLVWAPLAVVAGLTVRNARAMDAVFAPLGLSGSTYMLTGRLYRGMVGGREAAVYVYRGPTVELLLHVPVRAAFRVVAREAVLGPVGGALGATPLAVDEPLLEEFAIYAPDQYWARELLSLPTAVRAVRWLMASGAPWAVFRQVELSGGELALHLYGSRGWLSAAVDGAEVRGWLEAALALANEMQTLPPSQEAAATTTPTDRSRQDLSRFVTWAVAAIVVGLPLLAIAVFALVLVAVSSA